MPGGDGAGGMMVAEVLVADVRRRWCWWPVRGADGGDVDDTLVVTSVLILVMMLVLLYWR
jgi:hypothetical protein